MYMYNIHMPINICICFIIYVQILSTPVMTSIKEACRIHMIIRLYSFHDGIRKKKTKTFFDFLIKTSEKYFVGESGFLQRFVKDEDYRDLPFLYK